MSEKGTVFSTKEGTVFLEGTSPSVGDKGIIFNTPEGLRFQSGVSLGESDKAIVISTKEGNFLLGSQATATHRFNVSGQVYTWCLENPIEDEVINMSNHRTESDTTNASGNYHFKIYGGNDYYVSPQSPGEQYYKYTPTKRSYYNVSQSYPNQNYQEDYFEYIKIHLKVTEHSFTNNAGCGADLYLGDNRSVRETYPEGACVYCTYDSVNNTNIYYDCSNRSCNTSAFGSRIGKLWRTTSFMEPDYIPNEPLWDFQSQLASFLKTYPNASHINFYSTCSMAHVTSYHNTAQYGSRDNVSENYRPYIVMKKNGSNENETRINPIADVSFRKEVFNCWWNPEMQCWNDGDLRTRASKDVDGPVQTDCGHFVITFDRADFTNMSIY